MNDSELMALYGAVVSDAKSESEVLGHFTGVMTKITPYAEGDPVRFTGDDTEMQADRIGLHVQSKDTPPKFGQVFVDAEKFNELNLTYGDVVFVEFDYCEAEDRTSRSGNKYVSVGKARDVTYRKIGHVALKSNQRDANGNVVMKDGKAVMVDSGRGEIKYPRFVKPEPMTVAGLLGGRRVR